jgi:amidohydrolase
MTPEEMKAAALAEIDRRGEEAIAVAQDILAHPEPGFREHRTSARVAEKFADLGIEFESGLAITGLKATLSGGAPGPTVAVMGELDSLIVLGHPHADQETDAAHACGHHCQIGSMLAVAMGLRAAGVMDSLAGRVSLIAVPAEEFIEVGFRDELRRQGKIEFLGGKAEFIRLGALDDVDIAMMTHTESRKRGNGRIGVGATNNGFVAKLVKFTGRAAHAGGAPHRGINALNAANIALTAIHAQRETFREEDTIRVHPIITRGGAAVNSVPADVRMETFVRGRTTDAFLSAAAKVERALRAGALAVGGSVTITTLPGCLPIQHDADLQELYVANAKSLVGSDGVVVLGHRTGSTDMGDVSQIMPVLHPYVSAADGVAHGDDYIIQDYELAVVTAAKAMAMTVIDLLADGAGRAREITANYDAPMSKEEYLAFLRGMLGEETFAE